MAALKVISRALALCSTQGRRPGNAPGQEELRPKECQKSWPVGKTVPAAAGLQRVMVGEEEKS